MLMTIVADFKQFNIAKEFALSNVKDNQVMIIQLINDHYYVKSAETDKKDISMLTDFLLDYMYDNNCYVLGFTCIFRGWNSDCNLFIEINY